MEYALRCNRFRQQLEYPQRHHPNYKDIRDKIRIANFEHAFHQAKGIIASPQRQRPVQRMKTIETPMQPVRSRMGENDYDRTTHWTEVTYSTELKMRRTDRMAATTNQRLNHSMADGHTPKKRKTHFLTVVSRLPGMSKSKNKTTF